MYPESIDLSRSSTARAFVLDKYAFASDAAPNSRAMCLRMLSRYLHFNRLFHTPPPNPHVGAVAHTQMSGFTCGIGGQGSGEGFDKQVTTTTKAGQARRPSSPRVASQHNKQKTNTQQHERKRPQQVSTQPGT